MDGWMEFGLVAKTTYIIVTDWLPNEMSLTHGGDVSALIVTPSTKFAL